MPLVTITEAAKLANLSRPHFQTNYVRNGKVAVNRSDPRKPKIDTAEIIRVFGRLHQNNTDSDSENNPNNDDENRQNEELLRKIEKLEAEKAGLEQLAGERKERLEEKNALLTEKSKEIEYQRERIHNLETRYDRLIESKTKEKRWWQFW